MPPRAKAKAKRPERVYIIDTVIEIPTADAGIGLAADAPLAPNSRIVYEGVTIDEKRLTELKRMAKEDAKTQYLAYIMASGKKGTYIDAHPRHPGSAAWFAKRVNEPRPGTTANMVLVHERPKGGQPRPVFVTVRDVKAGEELTCKYGSSYTRVGYKAGRAPKKPSWL